MHLGRAKSGSSQTQSRKRRRIAPEEAPESSASSEPMPASSEDSSLFSVTNEAKESDSSPSKRRRLTRLSASSMESPSVGSVDVAAEEDAESEPDGTALGSTDVEMANEDAGNRSSESSSNEEGGVEESLAGDESKDESAGEQQVMDESTDTTVNDHWFVGRKKNCPHRIKLRSVIEDLMKHTLKPKAMLAETKGMVSTFPQRDKLLRQRCIDAVMNKCKISGQFCCRMFA